MPTKPIDAIDITLDPASSVPLNEQLYRAVRERIGKRLFAGDKLPASRDLARLLGVGRVTVTTAYGRLQAEGFLEAKPGVGTVVAERMSVNRAEDWSEPQAGEDAEAPKSAVRSPALGRSAAAAVEAARFHVQALEPLAVINPDFDSLPGRKWTQIVARVSKSPWQHNGYCLPGGFPAFRKTIADYVRQTRGILCEPEEVVITTGIQQGIALCAEVLFNEGERIAVEDPGFEPHRHALRFLGLETVPTPLDESGLSTKALKAADGLRAALDRADGVPGRVVYLGSFTKMIYPGFNIGYLVAPSVEVALAFEGAKLLLDRHTSEVHQAILTEFIGGGHYDAHIRRLKRLYEKRRAAAVRAIGRFCSGFGRLIPSNQGTHLTFLFHDPKLSDVEVSERLRKEERIETRALSLCYQKAPAQNGLLLGFAGFTESEIETAVRKMAIAVEAMRRGR